MGPAFFCLLSCSDPPTPPATPAPSDGLPRYSTAPHVQWAGLAPTDRILAVFVDEPGGPLDRLAHDPDVATFLNDRFSPIFLPPELAPDLPEAIWFVDRSGCLRHAPIRPLTPPDFIAAANTVMLNSPPQTYRPTPEKWGVSVPESHPLWLACVSESAVYLPSGK